MAFDLERVRLREMKNKEHRYGVSLVWFPQQALLDAANAFISSVAGSYPLFLKPYPVLHASVLRCKSLLTPPESFKEIPLLAIGARELHCADITARQMILCDDGVLRLQCSSPALGTSDALERFFEANELAFEQVEVPWVSLGLLNRKQYASAQAIEALQAAVGNAKFPRMRCRVDCLHAVAYEDILLRSHHVLAVLRLGGITP